MCLFFSCVSLSTALLPVVESLHGITVTPETARAFVANLGFDVEEFQSIPGDLLSICHLWMDRRSVCYVEELTVALIHTRGLGKFTTRLCDHGKYGWGNYLLLEVYDLFTQTLCVHVSDAFTIRLFKETSQQCNLYK